LPDNGLANLTLETIDQVRLLGNSILDALNVRLHNPFSSYP
jgi:hypothetical protein